jgi:hypothetical protein
MLGSERDQLLGRNLDSFLAPNSARDLHAMLTRLSDGASTELGTLQLASTHGAARSVHASARRDPDDRHFLVAFMDVAERAQYLLASNHIEQLNAWREVCPLDNPARCGCRKRAR